MIWSIHTAVHELERPNAIRADEFYSFLGRTQTGRHNGRPEVSYGS